MLTNEQTHELTELTINELELEADALRRAMVNAVDDRQRRDLMYRHYAVVLQIEVAMEQAIELQ